MPCRLHQYPLIPLIHYLGAGEIKKGEDDILRDVKFFSISALSKIPFYPDIREELKRGYDTGFSEPAKFLGNKWGQVSTFDN